MEMKHGSGSKRDWSNSSNERTENAKS